MKFTSREILGAGLLVLSGLSSCLAWAAFFRAVNTYAGIYAWQPVVYFSLLAIVFLLGALIWDGFIERGLAALLLFVPSLWFAHTWYHVLAVCAGTGLALLSQRRVSEETRDRLKVRFGKIVPAGQFLFMLALSLVLSSAYFVSISRATWAELIPRFHLGEESAGALFHVVTFFNPDLSTLSESGLTVDDFLESIEDKNQIENGGLVRSDTLEPVNEFLRLHNLESQMADPVTLSHEIYLLTGRAQIATLIGRPVRGNEKIADVFSLAVEQKFVKLLSGPGTAERLPSQAVPFFLTLLLFLTLLSLGSLLAILWTAVGAFLFMLCVKAGWIHIASVPAERDVLTA